MPQITEEEMQEYEDLKRWAKRENVFKSAREIENLEDDIDAPVKNCVAMFALLGCQPFYSCCGFDYDGQPFHKSHQYGRPYFILSANKRTIDFLEISLKYKMPWTPTHNGNFVNYEITAGMNPHWRQHECIHFSEECVIGIRSLENLLWLLRGAFAESVVLEDTNRTSKSECEYWQYPPKKPWKIVRDDFFNSITRN